jgi:uncharacterized protein YdeI (YjbR/CyaY-like superfamily)
MAAADAELFQPSDLTELRDWLAANHRRGVGVWLVRWRSVTGRETVSYEDVVREALCWGWIDGQARTIDAERTAQWVAPRKPGSGWAATNKARIIELEAQGRIQPAGRAVIDQAKADGSWTLLDSVEALQEPDELAAALDANPAARAAWDTFPPSVRKLGLTSIAMAKRPETKAARIATIVTKAARSERPA